MKPINFKISFFIIVIIINATVSARGNTPLSEEFTPGKISSFICSLINNGEYYRAYVELLRLNSFYPSYMDKSVYDITANYLFYKSRKYDDLLKLEEMRKDIFIPVSLFRVDSLTRLKKLDEAEAELQQLYESPDSTEFISLLKKRKLYFSLMNNKTDTVNSEDYTAYEELFIFSETVHRKKKSPGLGMLAGIIPGMGYIYAGETGTGIVSMIVIGAGSAVTYASYRNGPQSLALITGLITFFFYGGSIAGGYMQTAKYNSRLMDTLDLRLNRELMPEKDLDEIYYKFGLSSSACK